MEEVGGRGAVHHQHVAVHAAAQEAFHARAAVLGALVLVAVRKQQHQAVHGVPLLLGAAQVLVQDDLGAVHEVAELGLPEGEHLRRGERVAVLEAEHRVLAQGGVVDLEQRLALLQVLQVDVLLVAVLHLHDGMAVAEGAALHVLAGHAHGMALEQQRPVGQQLAHAPVQLVLLQHLLAGLQDALQLAEELLALGHLGQLVADELQGLAVHTGVRALGEDGAVRALEAFPAVGEEGLDAALLDLLALVQPLLQHLLELLLHLLGQVGLDGAALLQLLPVDLARIGVLGDGLVQHRLGELGLVALVVAVAPVAQQVDEHVGAELLAVVQRDLHGQAHGLGVVAVHVEDRAQRHLAHIGAVGAAAAVHVVGGEAHLVVHHHVQGASGAVGLVLGHLHHLVHHALARDGGITVDHDGHHLLRLEGVVVLDDGAGDALHHGGHALQVAGVGAQGELHLLLRVGDHPAAVAHVVLHVALHQRVVVVLAFELAEDALVGLVQRVGQHVQAAAVGHADHHVLHAVLVGAALDHPVQRGDQRFTALDAETLLPEELLPEELLEHHRLVQLVEDLLFILDAEVGLVAVALHALLQPAHLLGVADVAVLDADAAAVGLLDVLHDPPQGGAADADLVAGVELGVQVAVAEAEGGQLQRGPVGAPGTDGVRVGEQVPPGSIPVDQVQHLELLEDVGVVAGDPGPFVGQHRVVRAGQFKALEEAGPAGLHAAGVVPILLVEVVEPGAVDVAQVGMFVHRAAAGPGSKGSHAARPLYGTDAQGVPVPPPRLEKRMRVSTFCRARSTTRPASSGSPPMAMASRVQLSGTSTR